MSRLPSLGRQGEGWLVLQLLLMAGIVGSSLFFEPFLRDTPRLVVGGLGLAMVVAGVGLVALAAGRLGPAATPLPRPKPGSQLVADGPYRHVRHPIYVGVVLSAIGWALLTASLPALILVGLLAVLLDLKARREEVWLTESHPGYDEYRRRTRRFLPRLY
ncbi:MAG TPA: isoprenylcysteine carboxylmethyltransferase family protein [Candidatus Limnocylindrales bacterium]|nr:isoprenylcysteine carboxylmethyltransferase family protein [Candidatus Limnocylindrales bacterium]